MLAPINDVYLHYELSGPADAPAIVFSNALGAALGIWDDVVDALGSDFRILRYDTRGHGGSATARRAVTIDDLAADFGALMEFAHIEAAHVVGVSLGGMTALALASRQPERVKSLTVVASLAHVPPSDMWAQRAAAVRAGGPEAVVDQAMGRWFTEGFRKSHATKIGDIRAGFLAADSEGYALCTEALMKVDLRDRLGGLKVPTRIVAGSEDSVTPPALAEAMQKAIAGSTLTVVPGVAHMIPVEKPDAVVEQIRAAVGA